MSAQTAEAQPMTADISGDMPNSAVVSQDLDVQSGLANQADDGTQVTVSSTPAFADGRTPSLSVGYEVVGAAVTKDADSHVYDSLRTHAEKTLHKIGIDDAVIQSALQFSDGIKNRDAGTLALLADTLTRTQDVQEDDLPEWVAEAIAFLNSLPQDVLDGYKQAVTQLTRRDWTDVALMASFLTLYLGGNAAVFYGLRNHPKARAAFISLQLLVVTACGGGGGGQTEPTPVVIASAPAISQPTEAPTPVPVTSTPDANAYATEVPPSSVYGPPHQSESVYTAGSGGSGRNEILNAGLDEQTLVNYENAAFQWAADHGYKAGSVEITYLSNGQAGDNYRWQMVLRNTSTGNILWAQTEGGGIRTFPTGILIDPDTGLVQVDPTTTVLELPDTKSAEVRFVSGGFVVVLGGEKVTKDGVTYYTEWFNTTTGKFEKIPEVAALATQEAPVAPPVIPFSEFATFTMDRFVPISHDDRIQMNRDIASGKDSAFPEDVSTIDPIVLTVHKDKITGGISASFVCRPDVNCKVRYAVTDGIPMLVWEIIVKGPDGVNIKVPFATSFIPEFDSLPEDNQLNLLRGLINGSGWLTLNILLYEEIPGYPPTADAAKLLEQTDARVKLGQGIIDAQTADDAVLVTNL